MRTGWAAPSLRSQNAEEALTLSLCPHKKWGPAQWLTLSAHLTIRCSAATSAVMGDALRGSLRVEEVAYLVLQRELALVCHSERLKGAKNLVGGLSSPTARPDSSALRASE